MMRHAMKNERRDATEHPTTPWYRAGLRFECTGCSECCKSRGAYSHVYASDREFAAMASSLDLPLAEFEAKFTKVDRDGRREMRFRQGACIFLAQDGKCRVYQARPTQCRTFPFWRENLEKSVWEGEIAAGCEGVGRGKRFTRAEIDEIARQADAEE